MILSPELPSPIRDAAFQPRRATFACNVKFEVSIYILNDSLHNLFFFGSHKSHATSERRWQAKDVYVVPARAQNKIVFSSGLHFILAL